MGNIFSRVHDYVFTLFLRCFTHYNENEKAIQEWIEAKNQQWTEAPDNQVIIDIPLTLCSCIGYSSLKIPDNVLTLIIQHKKSRFDWPVKMPNLPSSLYKLELKNVNIKEWSNFHNLVGFKIENSIVPPITSLSSHLYSLKIINSNVKIQCPFPNYLREFVCDNSDVLKLPLFPEGLEILELNNQNITLAQQLPNSIRCLTLKNTRLLNFTSLPQNLNSLKCVNYPFSSLPSLPDNLSTLEIIDSNITNLPELPVYLRYFICTNIPLESLPPLPEYLLYLSISNTKIHRLPDFPNTLYQLSLYNQLIDEIPPLPQSIRLITLPQSDVLPIKEKTCMYHFHGNSTIEHKNCFGKKWTCIFETPEEFYRKWKKEFEQQKMERHRQRCNEFKEELMINRWNSKTMIEWCWDEEEKKEWRLYAN